MTRKMDIYLYSGTKHLGFIALAAIKVRKLLADIFYICYSEQNAVVAELVDAQR